MRYGVFSDVHSNLEALEACLQLFKKEKIQSFLCLGDIVGYGPNPNECVDKIAGLKKIQITGGNHDYAVAGLRDTDWFNDFAVRSINWTKRQIKNENKGFLMRLPRLVDASLFTLSHGSPRDPVDEYILTPRQFLDNLEFFRTPICFVGHTHVPSVFYTDALGIIQQKHLDDATTFEYDPQGKTIINVGSVGQPRDGDNRACCLIYDSDKHTVQTFRCPYDITSVQNKMRQNQLPLFLIERLEYGR